MLLKAFRTYLQFVNSGLYFRKEHVIGLENVPANGTPVIIVANHQNCLNDPLCVCLKLTDRRMNFLARANVFKNPVFNKILRAMGLLPAYRMGHEGLSAVNKNFETFEDAGNSLRDGETVMLYPEAGHQDKRWLGTFKLGYLRIAFAAAEKMNFEQDIMILPSCNHYSNYFHARTDMVIKFGKRDVILYTGALSFVFSVVRMFFYIRNVWVYTALNIMTLLGQTAFTMLIWALVSDCLDYSEWKTGFRSDGSMYSMYTFSRKIGSTIASSGLAFSLGLVGYVSGENVVQTAGAVKGIYYVCNAIPTICYALILIGIGLIFNLDKKKTDQMYAEMAAKREAK